MPHFINYQDKASPQYASSTVEAAGFLLSCDSVFRAFTEAVNLYRLYGEKDNEKFEQSIGAMISEEERDELIRIFAFSSSQRGELAELLIRKIDRTDFFKTSSSEYLCHRDVKIYNDQAIILCSGKNYDNCHFKACSEVKMINKHHLYLIWDEAAFIEIKFDLANNDASQKCLWLATLEEYDISRNVKVIFFSLGEDPLRGHLYWRCPELKDSKYSGKFDYYEGRRLVSMLPILRN